MPTRNERCFCGSGRRFKHCHGAWSVHTLDSPIENWHTTPQHVRDAFDRQQKARAEHYAIHGLHRPPLVTGEGGGRLVVRGEKVIHWGGGPHFLNFLESDLLREMGEAFGQNTQHPLHVWWTAMRAQAKARQHLGANRGLASTVAVLNFLTVANDLFVIADNTNQRDRLVKSLRVADQFHGARYELMIAACLVRAGFTFEFSDEEDSTSAHCGGLAVHKRTGKRYAGEMKAKGRPGLLGKPGERPANESMKGKVDRLLREALAKPADDDRLVFIDMNLPPAPEWPGEGVWWQEDAVASIRAVEAQPGKLPAGTRGLLVFTNLPANHMMLDDYYVGPETAFTGFNRPEFTPDMPVLSESHPDIADLFNAFKNHDRIQETF